jgi:L-ascorbate metabolism protein UlaG (beta-lactamase superfamily)
MATEMLKNITWLGHDGFLIRAGGKTIAIDPYEVGDAPKADIILITHEHFDHCSEADIAKLAKPETVVITEPQAAAKLSGDVRTLAPGQSIEIDGITIKAVPAYNTSKPFHPKANHWLGFVIEADDFTLYHAGDTDLIDEMAQLGVVDIALLPVSGTFVMDWEQAVQAAKIIKPKIAIPMHYGGIVGTVSDAEKFAQALEGICKVEVLSK